MWAIYCLLITLETDFRRNWSSIERSSSDENVEWEDFQNWQYVWVNFCAMWSLDRSASLKQISTAWEQSQRHSDV